MGERLHIGDGGEAIRALTGLLHPRHLRLMVESLPFFFAAANPEGLVIYVNGVAREWLGLGEEEQPENLWLPPDVMAYAKEAAARGVWRGVRRRFLSRVEGAGGGRTVEQTIVAARDEDGQVAFYSTVAVDITEQRRLEAERRRLLSIIEETPDFVSTADATGRVLYLNRAGRIMIGLDPDGDLAGLNVRDFRSEAAIRRLFDESFPTAAREGQWEGETTLRARDGTEIPVWQVIVAHKDGNEKVKYYSTIMRDNSERRQMEDRLRHAATHDPLTGAKNRRYFEQYLASELARTGRTGGEGAVVLIDLDKFKRVNDRFGHHVGDGVLRHTVRVAEKELRAGDTLARIGGDEFVVLLPDTRPREAEKVAARLVERLEAEPFVVDGEAIRIYASAGVAGYGAGRIGAKPLLKDVDGAMYKAKRSGGSRVASA